MAQEPSFKSIFPEFDSREGRHQAVPARDVLLFTVFTLFLETSIICARSQPAGGRTGKERSAGPESDRRR
jgi:hypothetical protein